MAPIRAAGGVVSRRRGDTREIALVHRPRYDDWSLPKGTPQPGEHLAVTARREVTEETGLRVALMTYVGRSSYTRRKRRKTVDFWAMRSQSGEFRVNPETDDLTWAAADDAHQALSYESDRRIVECFVAAPEVDSVVLLVRHADAGRSADWEADDRLRPLSRKGQRQAEQLRVALPCWAPTRVVAADRARCAQTVEPAARELGLTVETDKAFSEDVGTADPDAPVDRLRSLAAPGTHTICCSQGGVIPQTVAGLAIADRARPETVTAAGRVAAAEGSQIAAAKGSTWVLGFASGQLTSAQYIADFDPELT